MPRMKHVGPAVAKTTEQQSAPAADAGAAVPSKPNMAANAEEVSTGFPPKDWLIDEPELRTEEAVAALAGRCIQYIKQMDWKLKVRLAHRALALLFAQRLSLSLWLVQGPNTNDVKRFCVKERISYEWLIKKAPGWKKTIASGGVPALRLVQQCARGASTQSKTKTAKQLKRRAVLSTEKKKVEVVEIDDEDDCAAVAAASVQVAVTVPESGAAQKTICIDASARANKRQKQTHSSSFSEPAVKLLRLFERITSLTQLYTEASSEAERSEAIAKSAEQEAAKCREEANKLKVRQGVIFAELSTAKLAMTSQLPDAFQPPGGPRVSPSGWPRVTACMPPLLLCYDS